MKTAALVGLAAGLVLVTTLMAPMVAAALAAAGGHFRFGRVYDRVFEVLLVGALAVAWRRLDLGGPADWGLRDGVWPRRLALGLVVGVAGVATALLLAGAGGAVLPALRFPAGKTLRKSIAGILAALLVGVGEETLFRGILLRRFRADVGARAGVVLCTAVYAVVHALRARAVASTGFAAGVERTVGLAAPLADPMVWPGVAGLFALGLVLAVARLGTASLWVPIGIHAAWVGVFRVGRLFVDIRARPAWLVGPGWPPLIGGVAGLVGVAVTAIALRALLAGREVGGDSRARPAFSP